MQVSKRLVVQKEIPIDVAKETELLTSMDIAMAEEYCKAGDIPIGLKKFRDTIPKIYNEQEKRVVTNKYLNYAMTLGQQLIDALKFLPALELYREMLGFPGFPVTVYKNVQIRKQKSSVSSSFNSSI